MLHEFPTIISDRFCTRLHSGLGEWTVAEEAVAEPRLEELVGNMRDIWNRVRLLGVSSIATINIILFVDQFALSEWLFTSLAMSFAANRFWKVRSIFKLLSFFDSAKLWERKVEHRLRRSEHGKLLLLGLLLSKHHRLGRSSFCHILLEPILRKFAWSHRRLWSRKIPESSHIRLYDCDFCWYSHSFLLAQTLFTLV